jgi:hypothetical protein
MKQRDTKPMQNSLYNIFYMDTFIHEQMHIQLNFEMYWEESNMN